MRTNPDTPIDPLGQLGKAIKPAAAPVPDANRAFEQATDRPLIGNADPAIKSIVDTLKRKQNERDEDYGCDLKQSPIFTGVYVYSTTPEEQAAISDLANWMRWMSAELQGVEDARAALGDPYTRALLGCI